METLTMYLIKSSVWLTGFALVYALFLRNERFFVLNRFYLISGLLCSVLFPLYTWHYTVVVPIVPNVEVPDAALIGISNTEESFSVRNMLLILYWLGIAYFIYRILRQTLPVFRIIRKSETHTYRSAKLIRTNAYPASFSFFSFVFVNPSIDETEANEIVNHELEHIRQQHWIDLLLFEILRTMQWFNPAVWFYGHLIRQNHEYLADERALQRSSNPAVYRAALLNQMFGGPVISLANSFNYSLNKKRFIMMKHTIKSPVRKLKLLFVLPLIAGIFYAFATPEYAFQNEDNSGKEAVNTTQETKTVTGKVIDESGKPLKNASVVIAGKTVGTITDDSGNFTLKVTDDSPLFISYVGFESQKVAPDFKNEMAIHLTKKVFVILSDEPLDKVKKEEPLNVTDSKALIIVDGSEIGKGELDQIKPDKIESVSVLKGETATKLYGDKGKNGVVLVTLKSDKKNTETFKVQADSPLKIRSVDGSGKEPLYVKDWVITDSKEIQNIPPDDIESIRVWKGEEATKKYGEKGKNGVVEITMKKKSDVFVMVEELPEFPGGPDAINSFIKANLHYPQKAIDSGISGKVFVNFIVTKTGKIENVKVEKSLHPLLDEEAVRVIRLMPDWKPGTQNGEKVDVKFNAPVSFSNPNPKQ